jgi:glutamate racemase
MVRKLVNKDTDIIDGNEGTVKNLKRKLEDLEYIKEETINVTYYKSGIKIEDTSILQKYKEILSRLDNINK